MSDLPPLPQPPDPTTIAQWTGQLRTLIALAGGLGLGGAWLGHITDQEISGDLTAIFTVGGLALWAGAAIWSWIAKLRAATAARTSAVASAVQSAQTGTPVVVTVTPPGQPNIATLISPAEVAAAPAVPVGTLPSAAPPSP